MGQAIAVRTDYTSGEVRRLAQRTKDAGQARRLLAIAAVLDGSSREEAARVGGMDRQTLRDWVIRFNEQGPEGLIKHSLAGRAGQAHNRAQGLSCSDCRGRPDPRDPWGGALAGLRLDHATARRVRAVGVGRHDLPRFAQARLLASECAAEGVQAGLRDDRGVQKNFAARVADIRQNLPPGTPIEVWFQDEMRVGQKNKLTYRWARTGSRPRAVHDQRTQSTYLFGAICPEHGKGSGLVLPVCNAEAMQLHLDDIAAKVAPRAHAILIFDQAGWHGAKSLKTPSNVSLIPLPPRAART